MTERMILVGRVAGAFGVRGEMRITAYTEDPLALARFRDLRRQDGSAGLTVLSARPAKGCVIGRVQGVETKEAADALRGLRLYVAREDLPPAEEDEFYLADLIGAAVRHVVSGEALGRVKSVQNFGAGDILEIEPPTGGATWYLPFTRQAVPEVKITEALVLADPPQEVE